LHRGGIEQFKNFWLCESSRALKSNEAILIPAPLQDPVGIGERGAVIEAEADSLGICRERCDAVRRPLSFAIADDKEVIVVIHQFICRGEALAHR